MKKRQRKKNLHRGFCPRCNSDGGVELLRPLGTTIDKQFKNLMKGKCIAVECKCGYRI
jgi:hypothetical protein